VCWVAGRTFDRLDFLHDILAGCRCSWELLKGNGNHVALVGSNIHHNVGVDLDLIERLAHELRFGSVDAHLVVIECLVILKGHTIKNHFSDADRDGKVFPQHGSGRFQNPFDVRDLVGHAKTKTYKRQSEELGKQVCVRRRQAE
jgi:hypothetical protein